jgi:monoamine oxidase
VRVERIGHNADDVSLTTGAGTIRAAAAIVTVSTNVLASGAIAFDPAADDHLHAAAGLPLGCVDKLFLGMAEPEAVPPESHLLGNARSALTGSYYLRPLGHPVIECFFGGIAARAMVAAGDEGRFAFAREELGKLLGGKFAAGLTPLIGTWWNREPTIGGAYSHALPGCAGQRAVLRRPVGERLFFAGEATSAHDFSTAHGAWESGIAAADAVETVLGGR